jgi:hypothetical protein
MLSEVMLYSYINEEPYYPPKVPSQALLFPLSLNITTSLAKASRCLRRAGDLPESCHRSSLGEEQGR